MMELPLEFSTYTRQLLGDERYEELEKSLSMTPPVSVRINPAKCLFSIPDEWNPIPWSQFGYYLSQRPQFTFDPLLHAGCYYVQEASSMWVEQVLRTYVTRPCAMLDLCAAPGGKSTLSRAVLPEGSLLVSNEIVRTRAQVLAENVIKWGHPATVVTNNAPADFASLAGCFDVILADVPCSGEGMFRKDEASVGEWSADNVDVCWRRQRGIVADVWDCLRPGGLFIYSTCTYNALENEENVRWMVKEYGAELLDVPAEEAWGIAGDATSSGLPVYRFFSSRVQGEGFFLAVLRKPVGDAPLHEQAFEKGIQTEEQRPSKRNRKAKAPAAVVPEACKTWLGDATSYHWQVKDDSLRAFPIEWRPMLQRLEDSLQLLHAGMEVAVLKGRDWVPGHALAMTTALSETAFPRVELDCDTAVAYLRRESMVLDAAVPRGYVLVTHRGIPLGFVKNIGNRANNLYPNEWRIRSGYGKGEDIL